MEPTSCFYDGDDRCEPNHSNMLRNSSVVSSFTLVSWMLNLGKQTLKMFDVKQNDCGTQTATRDKWWTQSLFPAASLGVGLQIDVVENAAPEVPPLHQPPQSCSPPSSSDNGGRRGSDGVQGREYLLRKPCVVSVGVSGSSPLYTSGWSRFYLFKNRFCESGTMSDGRLELVWRAPSRFLSCFKAFHQRETGLRWAEGFWGGWWFSASLF